MSTIRYQFASVDKTTNYYTMTPDSYDKFIKENVTKTYKKSSHSVANKLDTQSASIYTRREVYLKLHHNC